VRGELAAERGHADLAVAAELLGHARLETKRLYPGPTAGDRAKASDLLLSTVREVSSPGCSKPTNYKSAALLRNPGVNSLSIIALQLSAIAADAQRARSTPPTAPGRTQRRRHVCDNTIAPHCGDPLLSQRICAF
jgi:hypothetical protein